MQSHSRALVGQGAVANVDDESFPQLGIQAGYRLPNQRGDITLGVLNLTGEDYRLNPVTPYNELPRERVFMARLRVKF
jgi:outer membrane receptor protein involved in Fe transport